MSDRDESDHDDSAGVCVNCQLARVLTEWRDSGADATAVVDAIRDMVNGLVYAALDEVFEDAEQPSDEKKAAH